MAIGAWSSGGALNTARGRLAGAGTQTAGLSFGGTTGSVSNVTEEYNGTSWSSGGNLGASKQSVGGAGTQDAGLCIGGFTTVVTAVCEEYNGTSWSNGGSLATAKQQVGGFGTQTAGVGAGGNTGSTVNVTEEYNGTSWSSGGNLGTTRRIGGTCGTLTAGLFAAGYDGASPLATCEEYNGTAWSAGGSIGTAMYGGGAFGTQDAAMHFGGYTYVTTSEAYNGTAWYVTDSLNTGKSYMSTGGTQADGFQAGGYVSGGSVSAVTEEWDYTPIDISSDANMTALLHFDGSDASTTITDEVGTATWTAAGTAQLDTAQKRFGTASLLLDGNSDTIYSDTQSPFDFGSSNFTIDFRVKFNAIASYDTFFFSNNNVEGVPQNFPWYKFDIGVVSGTTAKPRFYAFDNAQAVGSYTAGYEMTSAITIDDDEWHHFVLQRNGTTIEVKFDGVTQAMTETFALGTYTIDHSSDNRFVMGDDPQNTPRYIDGWIDEFRIINGTRKFTYDFVPPNEEYESSVAYDIIAALGEFTLTGQAATFHIGYTLIAALGTFTLTGIAAALKYGYKLVADAGTFALTGIDATLNSARSMVASVGAFTLTGIDVAFSYGYNLVASVGTFVTNFIENKIVYWIKRTKPSTTFNKRSKPSTSFSTRTKPSTTWTKRDTYLND